MSAGQKPVIWQTRPCGDWCKNRHGDMDHPENRECAGGRVEQALRLEQAEDSGGKPVLSFLWAELEHFPHHAEAHVCTGRGGEGEWFSQLTLTEAESWAWKLLSMVKRARGEAE